MTNFHFIGIKGSGMSALAQILHDLNKNVQGSDTEKYFFTQRPLEKRNIPIHSFDRNNIRKNQQIIVSAAYGEDHEEVARAKELQLSIKDYPQFLGEFIEQFTSIAVTGSHGKTSTTGLLAHVLGSIRPTSYLIGDGTGKGVTDSTHFVFEACEYRRHFLNYEPDYCIMTNIDYDHPDYFKNVQDVFASFQEMAMQVKKAIIACGDDEYLKKLRANVPVVYYGFDEHNDIRALHVKATEEGSTFDVYVRNHFYGTFTINEYGNHSILNALAVIALCHYENLLAKDVQTHLQSFAGVKRRFSTKAIGNQIIIDDYAHHPIEIAATIEATKQKYPNHEIVAIFQPHTFTRTKTFLHQFAKSLQEADYTYVCDIFSSARENDHALSSEHLIALIPGAKLISLSSIEQLKQYENSVLLFMGAGDIQKFQSAYEEKVSLVLKKKM